MASLKHILSSLGNGPVQRNLFGPVDHEQLQQEFQNILHKDLEDASRRWSFDFLLEKPLSEGDFQWEGVPGTSMPLIYSQNRVDKNQVEVQRIERSSKVVRESPSSSGKENIPCSPKRYRPKITLDKEKTPEKNENNTLKRKQTNITDFYSAKRRVVGTQRKSGQRF